MTERRGGADVAFFSAPINRGFATDIEATVQHGCHRGKNWPVPAYTIPFAFLTVTTIKRRTGWVINRTVSHIVETPE